MAGHDIRLARRLEIHALLLDLDRELLHDPSLFRMFHSVPDGKPDVSSVPQEKQEMYVLMYLNVFEAAYSTFRETRRLSRTEREIAVAWSEGIRYFFLDCIPATHVWWKHRDGYYATFRDYVDSLVGPPPNQESQREPQGAAA